MTGVNMNIIPTGHHVLIKLEETEEKSAGGIILAKATHKKEQAGSQVAEVLAVGQTAWAEYDTPWAKVGDKVLTVRYPGAQYDYEGDDKLNRVINDDEIIGVIA